MTIPSMLSTSRRWHWLRMQARTLHAPLLVAVLAMFGFGILMQYSAGVGDHQPWAMQQLARGAVGIALMLGIAFAPIKYVYRSAYGIYFLCLVVLVLVEAMGFAGMGAQRWLKVGAVNVQPSEFMKIGVVLAIAHYAAAQRRWTPRQLLYYVVPLVLMVVPAVLILRQPNLGTATILLLTGCAMLFLVGLPWRYIILAMVGLGAALPVAWEHMHDYQKQRVLTFLEPQSDPLGSGYNILQSMIAVGSGGLTGKGYMHGTQSQLDFLPEKHTDFIFTVIAEEWGFIGSLAVLLGYALICYFGWMIASHSRSRFGTFVAAGVVLLLTMHIAINVLMVMGVIPVVGVPLPLLSYGGSITLSTLMAMGLVLNVYRNRGTRL